jgi:hypothetical protein
MDGTRRVIGAALPYGAVWVGLYGLHSAWAALLLYHAGILLLGSRGPWRLVTGGWNARVGFAAVLAGGLSGPALYVLWPIIAAGGHDLNGPLAALGLTGGSWVVFIGYYSIIHPVLEEIHWRGWLGPPAASRPAWTDLAFAAYHALVLCRFVEWTWVVATVIILALTGWAWRACARRFGGLAVPAASHAAASLSLMVAAAALRQRVLGPP